MSGINTTVHTDLAGAFDFKTKLGFLADLPDPDASAVAALVTHGALRVGVNLSNFLLVTHTTDPEIGSSQPVGVSPDIGHALALKLGVQPEYVTFASPGDLADAAQEDRWDIGNIGAEPARAEHIAFTKAYCEIESTCLVPSGSAVQSFADVDQPGVRIATKHRAAYSLWLERNIQHATLVQVESIDASFDAFVEQRLEVLAGLRPRLIDDQKRLAGAKVLPDKFASVQQAVGTPRTRDDAGIAYLHRFVAAAIDSGLVSTLVQHHGVVGRLSVAGE